MELKIGERLVTMQILPAQGTYADMKILADLKNELGLTEAEHKEFSVVIEDGKIKWDTTKAVEKNFNIGTRATEIIKEQLKSLDKQKKINGTMIPVYEKFMND